MDVSAVITAPWFFLYVVMKVTLQFFALGASTSSSVLVAVKNMSKSLNMTRAREPFMINDPYCLLAQ